MNMEVLINVVILIVIVASLLKRVKEISQKGDEVKRVPQGPPDPLAETIKEAQRKSEMLKRMDRRSIREVFEEPERQQPAPELQQTEMPSAPPSLEELFRRLSGEPEPAAPQPVPEPVRAEPAPAPETALEQPPVRITRKRAKASRPVTRRTALSFEGPEVVRGVILSEILGPPMALRNERAV